MRTISLVCLLFFYLPLTSQALLSLSEAVEIAIENNFSIELSQIDEAMAAKAVYRANAGYGPLIDLNANATGTVNNVNQNYIDGREVKRLGRVISPNANLSMSWTLYDGGGMQATMERLQEISAAASVETQLQMQGIVADVMATYYEIMRHKGRLQFLNTIIKYYEERLAITEERWHVGRGSKLDYLQSKTDLNAQLSQRTVAQNQLRNSKVSLNALLNREVDTDFDVEPEIETSSKYNLDDLRKLVVEQNWDLAYLEHLRKINLWAEKEVEAQKKPRVALRSTLGYSYLNTNAGFLLSNRNASWSTGLSAVWNIFDGQHRNNQLAISKLQTQYSEKQYDHVLQNILAELTAVYNQFETDQQLLHFERENQSLAEENLSISVEKFKLGDSSILEVNEAQRSYDIAADRLVDAQYNVKISELALLRLTGTLIR